MSISENKIHTKKPALRTVLSNYYDYVIGAVPVTDGHFGKGGGPVHMRHVHCNGDEMGLVNCSHSNAVGMIKCHNGRDAGVVCEGTNV